MYAINLSLAGMSREDLALSVAAVGVLIAAGVNSLVKAGITVFLGQRATSLGVVVFLVSAVVAVVAELGIAVVQTQGIF